MEREKEYSIGSLDVGHLSILVRYRRRCYDDASFFIAKSRQQPLSLQQRWQHRQAMEFIPCTIKRAPCLPNQDTEICQECRRGGHNESFASPTEYGSTSYAAKRLIGGRATQNYDDDDDDCFDGTGLLVWPGSRLLASFLVDPLGARRFFPCAIDSLSNCCRERHSTTRVCSSVRGETSLHAVGGQDLSTATLTWGHCTRRDELMTTSTHDESSTCDIAVCGGKKLLPANIEVEVTTTAIGHTTPQAMDTKDGRSCCAVTRTKATYVASQTLDDTYGMVALEGTVRRPTSPTVLELGAGTGICGMAASLALGCPVIVTDRKKDVLANLQENIKLNGLGHTAQVVRLAWGGGARETRELPEQIWEQSPFKVRAPGCRVAGTDLH